MAQQLNKIILLLLLLCMSSYAQKNSDNIKRTSDDEGSKAPVNNDFGKFGQRREDISRWQINQLKNGALIVRLPTNKVAIDRLRALGNQTAADEKENETIAINKLYYRTFARFYKFSKLYFMYSNCSDSLLKGVRAGIFLDSNLVVDNAITMSESYYLLAEKDLVYHSSIGFVNQEQAKSIKEAGTPSKQCFVVLKNKFGHQLKHPFPYFKLFKSFNKGAAFDKEFFVAINKNGKTINVNLNRMYREDFLAKLASKLDKQLSAFYTRSINYQTVDSESSKFFY
jgi:hypothetical protein